MKLTSAEANKLLRKLQDDHSALTSRETDSRTFVAATTENLEDARPEYDYADTQEKLAALEARIRQVKHAVNLFNTVQTIDEGGMTIDQALIYKKGFSEKVSYKIIRRRFLHTADRNRAILALRKGDKDDGRRTV